MDILFWLVFGFIVGVVASVIDPASSSGGLIGPIVLGILGAMVGGFLGSLLFGVGVNGFNISSFLVAVAGSFLLLFTGRVLRRA